jgi:pimeloyl-ACP methyl ester carboxylesterase
VQTQPKQPTLRYAISSDGVTIAYTEFGEGPPLICLPPLPFSNIALLRMPSVQRGYDELARFMRVVLYDGRGSGSSQRDVADLGLDAMVRDLDAVVRHAGLDQFALLGYYFSALTAIAYSARHPENVNHLIIFNGAIGTQELMSGSFTEGLISLIDHDWDLFVESAVHAWMGWSVGDVGALMTEAFRSATTPAMARAVMEAARTMDVSSEVAQADVPSLVIHRRDERQVPLSVSGRLAAALPDAHLLRLEGSTAGMFIDDPEGDAGVLLDFLLPARSRAAAATNAEPEASPPSAGALSFGAARVATGVFISCSERSKETLARPFKELLASTGLHGYIVSDEPRPDTAWTPEEKVDAYLDLSSAVVVFATADLEAGADRFTRPNIGDEIGRARSKPHLRNRVVVLKEHGVTLPSNIDPAYETLDPAQPQAAFERALAQLRAWNMPGAVPPA